jgi:hypothetical protein
VVYCGLSVGRRSSEGGGRGRGYRRDAESAEGSKRRVSGEYCDEQKNGDAHSRILEEAPLECGSFFTGLDRKSTKGEQEILAGGVRNLI